MMTGNRHASYSVRMLVLTGGPALTQSSSSKAVSEEFPEAKQIHESAAFRPKLSGRTGRQAGRCGPTGLSRNPLSLPLAGETVPSTPRPTKRALVAHIGCNTAEDLLHNISLRGPALCHQLRPRSWIFRGQGLEWPLLPTALRNGARLRNLSGKWHTASDWSQHQQIEHEIATLAEFFWLADTNGLRIPEDSQSLRDYFAELRETPLGRIADRYYPTWPEREVLSLLALGQHYGIATRLLDWSYSALVAAYFAASKAVLAGRWETWHVNWDRR